MPPVIRVARENCKCSIDLFRSHQAGETVGHRHRSKGKQQLGSSAGSIGPTAGWPDGKHNMLRAIIPPLPDPGRKCFGSHLPTPAIQQDRGRWSSPLLFGKPLQERFLRPKGLALATREGSAARQIDLTERVVFVFRARAGTRTRANVYQSDLHEEENIGSGRAGRNALRTEYWKRHSVRVQYLILNPPQSEYQIS